MFTWVGSQFDTLLGSYVLGVVSALMTAIAPLALSVMTLWVMLYGWAVLRQEVHETVPVFVWKVFKVGLVLALSLQSALYLSTVNDTANGLALGVAATFVPGGVDPTTVTSPYALLDAFSDQATTQVSQIIRDAGVFRLDLFLAAGLFAVGTIVYLCVGLFVVTLSKLLLAFVIAVGPVFVFCLAWRPTQRFFDSWLSMVLNTVVLTWFAFFALGLSNFVGTHVFAAIQAGGGFLGTTFNALGESTRYCVLMILMAIVCFQAPGLAAALTGGAVVQHGLQLMQNALLVAGLRSGGRAPARATPAGAGGSVRPLLRLPDSVSRAARSLNGSGGAPSAPRDIPTPNVPAYRRAATRGRP